MTPKFHPLKVREVRPETNDCVSVAFDVPADFAEAYAYSPGQYLTLKQDIKGEEVRRSYSICSAPYEHDLRVAVKKVEQGRFSTYANEQLKAGDILEVMTPMGNFTTELDPQHPRQYVAFAAGSGITPLMALMKAILKAEPGSHFALFYGNRSFESIIFREEIEALKNRYLGRLSVHHVMSRENLGHPLFSGRIDEDKCASFCDLLFDPTEIDEYFLCGPEQMIHTVKDTLMERGVPGERIKFELFTTPSTQKGAVQKTKSPLREFDPKEESRVTITLDGNSFDLRIPYGGDTILDAALKAGADLPFACKGGVCCTCRAKLEEGEADMDVNYALEPDEVDAGFILTCQSHPRSEKLRVDFDVR